MILGLPGEQKADMLHHADVLSRLPIHSLKLHQLQIVKHTAMAAEFRHYPERFQLFDVDEYVTLVVEFLERLRPDILIERLAGQAPSDLLLAPRWNLKHTQIKQRVAQRLQALNTWQGRLCRTPALSLGTAPD
jgi:radical SAM superfamily enzyme